MDQNRLDIATNALAMTYHCERGRAFSLDWAEEVETRIQEKEEFWFGLDVCFSTMTFKVFKSLFPNPEKLTIEDIKNLAHRFQETMQSTVSAEGITMYLVNYGRVFPIPDVIDTWREKPLEIRARSFLTKLWLFAALTQMAGWLLNKRLNESEGPSEVDIPTRTLLVRMDFILDHLEMDGAWREYLLERWKNDMAGA